MVGLTCLRLGNLLSRSLAAETSLDVELERRFCAESDTENVNNSTALATTILSAVHI